MKRIVRTAVVYARRHFLVESSRLLFFRAHRSLVNVNSTFPHAGEDHGGRRLIVDEKRKDAYAREFRSVNALRAALVSRVFARSMVSAIDITASGAIIGITIMVIVRYHR